VVDDLIAYLVGPDEVLCVPNAANAAVLARQLAAAAPPAVRVTDLHHEYAVLAVQGPRSAELLAAVGLSVADLEYLAFVDTEHRGAPVRMCRTGYTGERGYELLPSWVHAPALWERLLAAAGPLDGRACGLGARDTLRTEMGYPLHGQDVGPGITPLQGGLSWAVGWNKPAFWGRAALHAERERGPSRRLRGLRATGSGVPRPHMAVRSPARAPLGEITSGTFSPTLRTGIALALLDPAVRVGDTAEVDIRGRMLPCEVVKPPFVPSHVR
jgi:aminomethyltransferase